MSAIRIIPAILPYTVEEFRQKLQMVEGLVDRVQIDVVGRAFSSDQSLGLEMYSDISSPLTLDVQLMVREPITYLNQCDQIGVERVFGHVEYMRSQEEFIGYAFTLGMQVGLAVDLPTPVSSIEQMLPQLDAVLLMAVEAGKSGQVFSERVIPKIEEIRKLHPSLPICIDGGIEVKTIGPCVKAGATEFAVGSFLWESSDIRSALQALGEASS